MPPEIIEFIAPLTIITTIGTMLLIGMKMRLSAKTNLQQASKGEELDRLTDAVEGLTEEIRMLRDDYGELHDRVDFAERLLARAKSPDEARERVSTPT